MAFDVGAAHRALAEQLRVVLGDSFNVYAFPEAGGSDDPRIEVAPGGSWVSPFGTFGPNGRGDLSVDVIVTLRGMTSEDRANAAFRLASAGLDASGNTQPKSLMDVVLADKTLGGVVESCTPVPSSTIQWDADDDRMVFPLLIVLKKSGAQA